MGADVGVAEVDEVGVPVAVEVGRAVVGVPVTVEVGRAVVGVRVVVGSMVVGVRVVVSWPSARVKVDEMMARTGRNFILCLEEGFCGG